MLKILLAVDGSRFSEDATQAVIRQIRPEQAEVCVLHIVEPLLLIPEFRSGNPEALKLSEEQLRRHGQDVVARAEHSLREAGFKVHTKIREGDHRAEIIDQATEWRADLIVLGSHGRKGVNRFLMGSVAEFVALHAACSVEIVRIREPKGA